MNTTTKRIFLLHGKGGSSSGTIRLLRDALLPCLTNPPEVALLDFPSTTADDYYAAVLSVAGKFPTGSMLVGVSLGGLVAAKLLQDNRPDLTAVALASPTYADGISLTKRITSKLCALYSHADSVISNRINWGDFTADHVDVDWMADHNLDPVKSRIAIMLSDFLGHGDFKSAVKGAGAGAPGKQ